MEGDKMGKREGKGERGGRGKMREEREDKNGKRRGSFAYTLVANEVNFFSNEFVGGKTAVWGWGFDPCAFSWLRHCWHASGAWKGKMEGEGK